MAPRRTGSRLRLKGVEAVERALRVLKVLQGQPQGATATELAAATGINRTTVTRVLVTLADHGFVAWDPDTGRYRLGLAALELASSYLAGSDVVQAARPEMERLRDTTGETVSLYVRDGLHRLCVQRVESLQPLRRSVAIGQRLPVYLGASGKVLLAFLPEPQREALLAQAPLDPDQMARLRADLAEAVRLGYAISVGEREPEVAAVAAPVLRPGGALAAALALSGPAQRLGPDRLRELGPVVQAAAQRIGLRLV